MPIRLPAPAPLHGGPDGQGWNRLSIAWGAVYDAQCALRPLYGSKLFESHNTPRARWGGFGPCIRDAGDGCEGCPIFNRREKLIAFGDRVLVRELERVDAQGRVRVEYHLMNKPEDGWASFSYRWTLDELAAVVGWVYDRPYADEHSVGFWLRRV